MAWATLAKARLFSGLSTSDISDADLTTLLAIADRQLRRDIQVRVFKQRIYGNINGTNTTFKIRLPVGMEFADTDMDNDVDASDLTVYKVKFNSTTEVREHTSAAITSVNVTNRTVVLTAAPTTTDTEYLVADFSYWSENIDYTQVANAASYYAAYLALRKRQSAASSAGGYRLGQLTVMGSSTAMSVEEAAAKALQEYEKMIAVLRPHEIFRAEGPDLPEIRDIPPTQGPKIVRTGYV
jgi:hypothetical protein